MIRLNPGSPEDREVISAFLGLRSNRDFQVCMDYVQRVLNQIRRANDTATEQQREWNQGWCQALQYVLDLPSVSIEIFKKTRAGP